MGSRQESASPKEPSAVTCRAQDSMAAIWAPYSWHHRQHRIGVEVYLQKTVIVVSPGQLHRKLEHMRSTYWVRPLVHLCVAYTVGNSSLEESFPTLSIDDGLILGPSPCKTQALSLSWALTARSRWNLNCRFGSVVDGWWSSLFHDLEWELLMLPTSKED